MSLKDQIKKDLIDALRNKDSEKSSVLRMLQSAIRNKEIDLRIDQISDEDALKVVAKEAKKRKESIESFAKGGRADLAEKEKKEFKLLEKYLPQQISDEEIEKYVTDVISQMSATKSDFGKVMGAAVKKIEGKADGTRIRSIVEKLLK